MRKIEKWCLKTAKKVKIDKYYSNREHSVKSEFTIDPHVLLPPLLPEMCFGVSQRFFDNGGLYSHQIGSQNRTSQQCEVFRSEQQNLFEANDVSDTGRGDAFDHDQVSVSDAHLLAGNVNHGEQSAVSAVVYLAVHF